MITVISPISQSLNPDPEYIFYYKNLIKSTKPLCNYARLVTFVIIRLNVSKEIMNGYYIQLFSAHGLIRSKDPEIGRDKDTGGQVKYVLELLENLSMHPLVRKVDLFTRRIIDKRVSSSYENEIEEVNEKARIVRVVCGGNSYRPKESL